MARARRPRRHRLTGIPTTYKGVRMRSRQEARWARMFDYLGWEWDYEPIDCNGWLPDFWMPAEEALLECKPALRPVDFEAACSKAESSGYVGRVIIVGARWSLAPGLVTTLTGINEPHTWLPWRITCASEDQEKWLALGWKNAGNAVQWKKS